MYRLIFIFLLSAPGMLLVAQSGEECSPLLATFGNMPGKGEKAGGHSQTVFFAVPIYSAETVFLRVFDPDCGGAYDRPCGLWETNTIFEVYGGEGCISELDARQQEPGGKYKSGKKLHTALFAKESEVDGQWISFGPFSPAMGETLEEYPGYAFFKLIVEGRTGDDGNLYALFVSSSGNSNEAIGNARIFDYCRTFFDGDSIRSLVSDICATGQYDVPIPVSLEPVGDKTGLEIIAEPVDH